MAAPEPEIARGDHVPNVEADCGMEAIPTATPPADADLDEQLSQEFADAALEHPKLIPPFATAGSLAAVVNCIREGNTVLGAIVTQLRDLNASIRAHLPS
jgi:hypothetical protein